MTIKADHAVPVLVRRRIAADEEDSVWKRCCQVRTALGVHLSDGSNTVVPAILPNEPAIEAG